MEEQERAKKRLRTDEEESAAGSVRPTSIAASAEQAGENDTDKQQKKQKKEEHKVEHNKENLVNQRYPSISQLISEEEENTNGSAKKRKQCMMSQWLKKGGSTPGKPMTKARKKRISARPQTRSSAPDVIVISDDED